MKISTGMKFKAIKTGIVFEVTKDYGIGAPKDYDGHFITDLSGWVEIMNMGTKEKFPVTRRYLKEAGIKRIQNERRNR